MGEVDLQLGKSYLLTTFLLFSQKLHNTYILCFWVQKSALNTVSVSIFYDLRYLFEYAFCQPVRMNVIINRHKFLSWLVYLQFLFCQFKKASALTFLLSNYTDINSERIVYQLYEYRNELSSGLFWQTIFTGNLAAEYEPCPRTVNSAIKADSVREKKKPGIIELYPEGCAILQDFIATIHRSHVKLLINFSWFRLDSASQMCLSVEKLFSQVILV